MPCRRLMRTRGVHGLDDSATSQRSLRRRRTNEMTLCDVAGGRPVPGRPTARDEARDGYSRRNHSGALLPATVFTVTFTQPLAVPWGTLTLTFVELQLT